MVICHLVMGKRFSNKICKDFMVERMSPVARIDRYIPSKGTILLLCSRSLPFFCRPFPADSSSREESWTESRARGEKKRKKEGKKRGWHAPAAREPFSRRRNDVATDYAEYSNLSIY